MDAENSASTIAILAVAALLPFLLAAGTCYLKFSVVFTLLRNALGLQQVPSNMVINAISLMLSMYVLYPIAAGLYEHYVGYGQPLDSVSSVVQFLDGGLDGYKAYLLRFADPELLAFFDRAQMSPLEAADAGAAVQEHSLFALLPAYTLSELKSAFQVGFYLYLPFVVVDLVVSSVLLSLGMMMMSPVTISAPIKLMLFVALDGWTLISKGLIEHYLQAAGT